MQVNYFQLLAAVQLLILNFDFFFKYLSYIALTKQQVNDRFAECVFHSKLAKLHESGLIGSH